MKFSKYVMDLEDSPVRSMINLNKIHTYQFCDNQLPESPNLIHVGLVHKPGSGYGTADSIIMTMPDGEEKETRSMPHSHPASEFFLFIGTDPDNPRDLGGEVEVWMGEGDEAEKYTITRSSVIFFPENTTHNPTWIKRVDRPFVFVAILNEPNVNDILDKPLPEDFSKSI